MTLDAFYETLRRRSRFPANKTRRQSNWLYEGVKINAPEFAARVHACTSLCPRGGPTRRAIPGPRCVPARSCTHPPGRGIGVRSRLPCEQNTIHDISLIANTGKKKTDLATFGTSRTSSGSPSGCFVFETPLAASSGGGGLLTLPTWIPARTSGTDTGTDESVPAPLPSNWDGPCEQNTPSV